MKKVIKPGRARKSINFIDNIVYSRQKDLEGNEMELKMSIMLQNGTARCVWHPDMTMRQTTRLRSRQFCGFLAADTVDAIRT